MAPRNSSAPAPRTRHGLSARRGNVVAADWKKIANARLQELRRRDACAELLQLQMQQELHRELSMRLHARCISRAGELADEISVAVASRLTS